MTDPTNLKRRVEPDTDRLDAILDLLAKARPTIVLPPWQRAALAQALAVDGGRVVIAFRRFATDVAQAAEVTGKALRRAIVDEIQWEVPIAPPGPAERMAAALHARQTRHTGPPPGRRRAPRTLGPIVRAGRPGW